MIIVKRGDIVLGIISGDYGKPRPVVVVQSDDFNPTHPSVTVCPLTSHLVKLPLFRITITPSQNNGLKVPSQIMVDKAATLHEDKLRECIGSLLPKEMTALNEALKLWLALS